MLTILVIRGALLESAHHGVIHYVGKFDVNQLANPTLWKDAVNNNISRRLSFISILLKLKHNFPINSI